ncbi:MAG: ImmA/IrrE family metallo-endopeptidase [Lactobacillus sp.]|nr:MAG: ImmA/IrrE family metallo-endopeptidase [Lactobacillus sp.]
MQRDFIQKTARDLIHKFGTNDPFKLCKGLHIPIYYDDTGSIIMGYNTMINRVPAIVLNTRNSEFEQIDVCFHELGHNRCGHRENTGFLQRNHLNVKTYGIEYEANCFMVDAMLEGSMPYEFETKEQYLNYYGVPSWAYNCIDWEHLKY